MNNDDILLLNLILTLRKNRTLYFSFAFVLLGFGDWHRPKSGNHSNPPMFYFYTSRKSQKAFVFLMFSGCLEMEHWREIG